MDFFCNNCDFCLGEFSNLDTDNNIHKSNPSLNFFENIQETCL